jgi:phosphatidylglycerol---prolipoprotein diacylglyceryl transferase
MRPVLLQLGPITLYSFGVFIALAFAAGGYLTLYLAKRERLTTNHFIDYFLYAALAGLIGARLWYVLFRPSEIDSFWQLFTLGGGGLALPGGLLLAITVLVLSMRRHRDPVWRWLDITAIGTLAGLTIGKIGSFLNGDSFGTATSLPWSTTFTDRLAPASIVGEPLHPLQLYAAILYAAAGLLLWYLHRRHGRSGLVFWAGLGLVAASQLVLEPLHAATDALIVGGGLTGLRVIIPTALVLMGLSIYVLLSRYRRPLGPKPRRQP